MDDLAARGAAHLELQREIVRSWLDRYMALAPIYARNPAVVALLRDPSDAARAAALNERLEAWNNATGAADTYVLDTKGYAIAASNWRSHRSFIGFDYSFRPYFRQAMEGRLGRYFALGTVSGRRGYYFSHPVRAGDEIVGVVVVKVPVEPIEQEMRRSTSPVFLTNAAGVIVLAGHPGWRMKTLGALGPAARDSIGRERQFELGALTPAPIDWRRGGRHPTAWARPDRSDDALEQFLRHSLPMAREGWTLHVLTPTAPARAQIVTATSLAGAVVVALALGVVLFWQRRLRMLERLAEREAARRALESAVAERTQDLSESNARLAREVVERKEAEAELRRTQGELVQAGKLAALGQMSAALSHEFNQPLAAIRTYADNAAAFLERERPDRASENLSRITRLTERMAQLSKHLTAFARKPRLNLTEVPLHAALDEALELLRARIERAEAGIRIEADPDLIVVAGRTRLQHVLMNLIGNALDAAGAAPGGPQITIRAAREDVALGGRVIVTVEDNGPGVAPEAMEKLFDPFFSTKGERGGLGLGLSISFNIVRDFGGQIRAENRAEGGARFIVSLRAAATPAAASPETAS